MAAPGNFDIAVERRDSEIVVVPNGEIDLATVDLVRGAVEAHWESGLGVVIDLRQVEFIDTSGLRYVLELNERAGREGFRFRLVRGPGAVQRVFDVSGLEPRLPFTDDPDEVAAPE